MQGLSRAQTTHRSLWKPLKRRPVSRRMHSLPRRKHLFANQPYTCSNTLRSEVDVTDYTRERYPDCGCSGPWNLHNSGMFRKPWAWLVDEAESFKYALQSTSKGSELRLVSLPAVRSSDDGGHAEVGGAWSDSVLGVLAP